jgi:hypothetical protein
METTRSPNDPVQLQRAARLAHRLLLVLPTQPHLAVLGIIRVALLQGVSVVITAE